MLQGNIGLGVFYVRFHPPPKKNRLFKLGRFNVYFRCNLNMSLSFMRQDG